MNDLNINRRSRFIEVYFNELHDHPIFLEMAEVAEESPWHREKSVAVHTDMVVSEFISRSPATWGRVDVIGALACAFHDFGKPAALEWVFKPERGNYKRFGGHEKISARIFEDWAVQNMEVMAYLGLDSTDIHKIGFLIEYHLPWAIKKHDKRRNLALTALYIERSCNAIDSYIFERVLLSDTYGRISDDAPTKRDNAENWVAEFIQFKQQLTLENEAWVPQPLLYVSIGPPGCGKSTFRQTLSEDVLIYNMDELRLEWYSSDYDEAYRLSTEDKKFSDKTHQHFIQLIKTGKPVYCDNTNASPKRRRFYVDQARRHGYRIVAVLFPVSYQTVVDRQQTRPDKAVPEHAVKRIWDAISVPQLGEFDEIWTVPSNLETE